MLYENDSQVDGIAEGFRRVKRQGWRLYILSCIQALNQNTTRTTRGTQPERPRDPDFSLSQGHLWFWRYATP